MTALASQPIPDIRVGSLPPPAIAELRAVTKTYYRPDGSILVEAVGRGQSAVDLAVPRGQISPSWVPAAPARAP